MLKFEIIVCDVCGFIVTLPVSYKMNLEDLVEAENEFVMKIRNRKLHFCDYHCFNKGLSKLKHQESFKNWFLKDFEVVDANE